MGILDRIKKWFYMSPEHDIYLPPRYQISDREKEEREKNKAADEFISNYTTAKNDIEYWSNEVIRLTEYIKNRKSELTRADIKNTLSPQRYMALKTSIEKALISLDFAQKSLGRLLILRAVSPEQIEQLKAEVITGFNNRKKENEEYKSKLDTLNEHISVYSSRENICTLLEKAENSIDEEEKNKIYEEIRKEFDIIKSFFSKTNDPKIIDEAFEKLINNKTDRKNFLAITKKQNTDLFKKLSEESKVILGISNVTNIEELTVTLASKYMENKSEAQQLDENIDNLSNVTHKQALKYLTLNFYGDLITKAEKVNEEINEANSQNYSLSPILAEKIEKASKEKRNNITSFFKNNLSRESIEAKKELSIAMYPSLGKIGNEKNLNDYIKQNNNFLNKLLISQITPEELINERNVHSLRQTIEIEHLIEKSEDIIEVSESKKITRNPLSYNFVKQNAMSVFTLDDKFLSNISALPETSETSTKTNMRKIAEHIINISKGIETRKKDSIAANKDENTTVSTNTEPAHTTEEQSSPEQPDTGKSANSEFDDIKASIDALNKANLSEEQPSPEQPDTSKSANSEFDAIKASIDALNKANAEPSNPEQPDTSKSANSEFNAIKASIDALNKANLSEEQPSPEQPDTGKSANSEFNAIKISIDALNRANAEPSNPEQPDTSKKTTETAEQKAKRIVNELFDRE